MTRYFAIAHYRTAAGNHGSTSFNVVASDEQHAQSKAMAKASTRGRSRIRIHLFRKEGTA